MVVDRQDKQVLGAAVFCASGTLAILFVLVVLGVIAPVWLLLPASWLVGAVMTWAYGKFTEIHSGQLTHR